jgi:lipopolysaccharide/colanic/teichoic acid biosynthesis glycosyltransferase
MVLTNRQNGAVSERVTPGLRQQQRALIWGLTTLDTLGLILAVSGAGLLRSELVDVIPIASFGWIERHVLASISAIPLMLLLFRLHGLYDVDHILSGTREYARIAHAATYGVLITLAVSYFAGGSPLVSRSWLLLTWALSIGFVGLGRFAARRLVRRLRRHGVLRTRVVIVGASALGVAIAEQCRAARNEGLDLMGFLDEYLPLGQPLLDDVAVIGRPADMLHGAAARLADEYVLVPQALPHERLEELSRVMASARGPTVRLAVSSTDLLTQGFLLVERGSIPLVTLKQARLDGLERALKSGCDVAGAGVAIVLLAPLALLALAGAVLARRYPLVQRYPIHGSARGEITLWLFSAAVTNWLPLRGLPALLAVLRGQLSLVGPRPRIRTADEPAAAAPWLTSVKPGLTGPWRLSGPGASLEVQEMQDLTYVRNYSIWEDVRILWESVWRLHHERQVLGLGRWQAPGMARGLQDVGSVALVKTG